MKAESPPPRESKRLRGILIVAVLLLAYLVGYAFVRDQREWWEEDFLGPDREPAIDSMFDETRTTDRLLYRLYFPLGWLEERFTGRKWSVGTATGDDEI